MAPQTFELFISFFLIGLGAYGGGTVVIPMIEHEIVSGHHWLSMGEFAQVISLSEMTPGPIAINSATFVGFQVAGFWGSLLSTVGVVLPSVILISTVIHLLRCFENNCHVYRLKQGMRPGVLALIVLAVISIGKASIYNTATVLTALFTFVLLIVLKNRVHPVLLILLAGIAGLFIL